ncbi:MAG: hypothetical protein KY469_15225 [Actinobacteria bacterium]|nr:hypothetical protein [Actinomycetota bacterium]
MELTAEAVAQSDRVVIVTPHVGIDLELVAKHATLVFDTRNALPRALPNVERL